MTRRLQRRVAPAPASPYIFPMTTSTRGKFSPELGTLLFLFAAPGVIGVLIPWLTTGWIVHAPFFGIAATYWFGWLLIAGGAALVLDSFIRFAREGRGTPAPIYPTETLVVTGAYRYVRNPMYVAVLALIVGQGFAIGCVNLLWYGLGFWALTHAFVLFYEEPTLRRTHGAAYEAYSKAVGRWIPRLTPWRG